MAGMSTVAITFGMLVFLVALALAFDFMNGLHDAANSIATVVSTGVLKPHVAVAFAATFNFIAIFIFHLKVAATVGKGIVEPEIIDHYVVFGALAFYAFLFIFFLIMYFQVTGAQAEVAAKQQEAQSLQAQAGSFKVFEDRQADLNKRQGVATKALGGRIAWSRLFTEVALVLPADSWLQTMRGDEKTLVITGLAIDDEGDQSSMGYKPVAKMLVRVSDLEQLQNVWLDASKHTVFLGKPVLDFTVGAEMALPKSENASSTSASPAPPSQQ
jgi:Tfp pilus assembly protein PilN